MTKFKYLEAFILVMHKNLGSTVQKKMTLQDHLNWYGENGWEIVTIETWFVTDPVKDATSYRVIFKQQYQ